MFNQLYEGSMMWANFLSCYLWWLLAGVLLGWLANYLLCKCWCNAEHGSVIVHTHPPAAAFAAPAPVAAPAAPAIVPVAAPAVVPDAAPKAAPAAALTIDIAAAKAAGIIVKGADDLQIIEGIGPKICGLFHAAGHVTFAQVAQLSVTQMAHILTEAGPRYKLANPETWAQQADLAANNRWAELKTLQDALSGGMTVPQARDKA
jgi:predicted flap endonuclease-1-like 5' DNA nuclease